MALTPATFKLFRTQHQKNPLASLDRNKLPQLTEDNGRVIVVIPALFRGARAHDFHSLFLGIFTPYCREYDGKIDAGIPILR